MELDAFTANLGIDQGRVVAPDGAVTFVLGSADGWTYDLATGDHVEVVQPLDLTEIAIVRASVRLRVPQDLGADLAWEASLVVDGVKHGRLTCPRGRSRESNDLSANVSKLSGVHSVGVRLELVRSA